MSPNTTYKFAKFITFPMNEQFDLHPVDVFRDLLEPTPSPPHSFENMDVAYRRFARSHLCRVIFHYEMYVQPILMVISEHFLVHGIQEDAFMIEVSVLMKQRPEDFESPYQLSQTAIQNEMALFCFFLGHEMKTFGIVVVEEISKLENVRV